VVKVVALGGGHGLAATLSAVRRYADDLCAIVSVADDGGSSGRLRAAFGIPPPGDLRKCLVALADPASMWTSAFEHRFDAGELEGHAFGNLVLAGLAASTGDFEVALAEAGRLLGAQGRVVPATVEPVVLKAAVRGAGGDGDDSITGQVAVGRSEGIAGVSLVPAARPWPRRTRSSSAPGRCSPASSPWWSSRPSGMRSPPHPAGRSMSATSGPSSRRRRGTTWPPMSTPCGPTDWTSTSSCASRTRFPWVCST
jgi:hypothetical protein